MFTTSIEKTFSMGELEVAFQKEKMWGKKDCIKKDIPQHILVLSFKGREKQISVCFCKQKSQRSS